MRTSDVSQYPVSTQHLSFKQNSRRIIVSFPAHVFIILVAWANSSTVQGKMTEKEVTLDYLKSLANNAEVLLIDVREPSELKSTGVIPGSINIPLSSLEDTLKNSSGEDFKKQFNRAKPSCDTPLVFSCRSGRRSATAMEIANKLGYSNVKHFPEGWLGWEEDLRRQT